ncbi:MAG: hypothetical protein K8M05_35500, partial [Deltaproteobacteria bacterium]|nr:hypothetical protein [Kofleriaceae bacterium]
MRGPLACAIAWLWLCAQPPPAEARCGDGQVDVSIRRTCAPCAYGSTNCPCAEVREALEPCDGADLDGATCQTQGFFAGTLRCTATCKLDTRRCTSLTSDVKLRHRTIGAAPASVSLAFAINVVSLGMIDTRAGTTTIVPYNWDLRGPWGKASQVPGAAALISGSLALARSGAALELYQHDYQGGATAVHAFADRRGLACTQGFRGGALLA